MIVRESISFERSKSPEEIKKIIRGDHYLPGEILIHRKNSAGWYNIVMIIKKLPPDLSNEICNRVLLLGAVYKGEFHPADVRFKGNLCTQYPIKIKLSYLNEEEENLIREYLTKSRLKKIKEILGITPIINGKKALQESLDFERGLDPKTAMGIGNPLIQLANELGMTYPEIKQDKKDLREIVAAAVNPGEEEDKDYKFAFYAVADDPVAYDISRDSRLFDVALWADGHPAEAIRILRTLDRVSESINFERGIDPKKTMGIGLEAPKKFSNIEEFADHVIAALPLIFDGKMPEDILTKQEDGMLPSSYYGKIAWWLSERGFEMPNGNSDWESGPEKAPKEFAYWPTPIVQRLQQMLGQKRWSLDYED